MNKFRGRSTTITEKSDVVTAAKNAMETWSMVTSANLVTPCSTSHISATFASVSSSKVSDHVFLESSPRCADSTASQLTADINEPPVMHLKSPHGSFESRCSTSKAALSHVDLIEAVSRFKEAETQITRKPKMQRFAEEVADRNMECLPASSPEGPDISHLEPALLQELLQPTQEASFEHPEIKMSAFREILFIVTVCLAQFLTQSALAQTISPLQLLIPTFQVDTETVAPYSAWYTAAYALTVGTFILPSGRFGDVYGHKLLFTIGWVWFALFSVLAGFSGKVQANGKNGEIFLIVCRAGQGIGPALLMPNALALLGTTYPPGKKKNMIFAMFGAAAPAGFVTGATFSALLAQRSDWEWEFWVLGILCAGICVSSIMIIPKLMPVNGIDEKHMQSPLWSRLRLIYSTLDGTGSLLGTTALILINISLNQAPLVSWSTPYTYFVLIIGIILLASFLISQRLVCNPLIPLRALNPDTFFVLITMALGWSSFGIWLFYTWSFMTSLQNMTPLLSSAYFAPAPLSGLLASLTTGFLLSRLHPKFIMCISMCAFFLGSTIMATTADVGRIYWTGIFWAVLFMPWGMDMSFPSATILLSDRAGPHSQGVAASLVNTVVNYSISVGLGLAGTVQRGVLLGKGEDELKADKSAWFMAMGLSGTGFVIASFYVGIGSLRRKKPARGENS